MAAVKLQNKEMNDNCEAIYKTMVAIRALTRVCLSDSISEWKSNKFLKHYQRDEGEKLLSIQREHNSSILKVTAEWIFVD